MASFNKVILLGNLTRDPQLSYLPSQTAVVEFGLAVNRKFKKQDGSQGEEVCFVDCQMFGKRAEVINKYVHKGNPIFIEGRLKFDSWQGKDGSKHSRLRVFVENFEFISGGQSGQGNQGGQSNYGNKSGQGQQYNQDQPPMPDEPFAPVDDDIPF